MSTKELRTTALIESVFTFPIRIYWEDTDAGGIVYYANYFKFFERTRTEWLRHLGVEQGSLLANEDSMFVVSQTDAKYHKPARCSRWRWRSCSPRGRWRSASNTR